MPIIKFNFIKGILHNQQKNIQRMNSSAILDGPDDSRCGKHIRSADFLSGDILIKHYIIVRTAESRIPLLRFLNFLRQPHIHKLCYKGGLVIQNYGKSDTVILEIVFYAAQNVKNMSSLCVYPCRKWHHLQLCRHN